MNTLKGWLGGLISAASGGIAGMLGPTLTDPDHFNLANPAGVKKMLLSAAFSGVVAVIAYLKQKPLPGVDQQSKP